MGVFNLLTSLLFISTSGFGDETYGGKNSPESLKHARLHYISNEKCSDFYRELKGAPDISNDMMCAYDDGKSPCQGDSGGPLYDRQTDAVVGIVSWGYRCG